MRADHAARAVAHGYLPRLGVAGVGRDNHDGSALAVLALEAPCLRYEHLLMSTHSREGLDEATRGGSNGLASDSSRDRGCSGAGQRGEASAGGGRSDTGDQKNGGGAQDSADDGAGARVAICP